MKRLEKETAFTRTSGITPCQAKGLEEDRIESRLQGQRFVTLVSMAGDGHDCRLDEVGHLAEARDETTTIHVGHKGVI